MNSRKKRMTTRPMSILGQDDVVEKYQHRGCIQQGNKQVLFPKEAEILQAKWRSFFYHSGVAVACWRSSSRAGGTSRLNKLMKKTGCVIGCSGEQVAEHAVMHHG